MIHVYKCDGSLNKTFGEYYCLHESSDSWIFFLPPFQTKLIKALDFSPSDFSKAPRKKKFSFLTNENPTFLFFWKEHWFHAILTLLPDNKYDLKIKISTPPLKEERALKYMDFDLALSLNNSKDLNLFNNELYLENSQKMKYTPNLKKEISKTIREIFQLLKANWFEKLVEESWCNSLWERVLEITKKEKEEFYKGLTEDKKEELARQGIEIVEID